MVWAGNHNPLPPHTHTDTHIPTRSRALLVVVGHPAVLLADRCWRELVRQCVAR